MIISRPFLRKLRSVPGKIVEKMKTRILCSITLKKKNLALYEIMLKNIVERGRSQMSLRRIRIAWRKTKATNTHSEYVILMLFHWHNGCTNAPQCYFYTCIACPVRCSLHETNRFRMVIAFR
jgi:hypothetical protein